MNFRQVIILFGVALLALAITACSPVATPVPDETKHLEEETVAITDIEQAGEGVSDSSILGTSWSVVTYGLESDVAPVENTTLTVNFMADRYTGYTGCNYMLGVYDATKDTIRARWPSLSASSCADEVLARQETDFLTALTTAETFTSTDGHLKLYVGDVSVMSLEPLEPVPFEGTTWNLQFIQQQPVGWVPPLNDTTLTAVFDGKTVSGSAGCNDYTGSYTINYRVIEFSDITSTEKACESQELMQQESAYLQALENAAIIMSHARSFELRDSEGVSMMIFGPE